MASANVNVGMFLTATGNRDGDYLELGNQWSDIRIYRYDESLGGSGHYFWVGGSEGDDSTWETMAEALERALSILTQYENGRLD